MVYKIKEGILILALTLCIYPISGVAQSYEINQAKQAFQEQEYQKVVSITESVLIHDSLNFEAHQLRASSLLAQNKVDLAQVAANEGLHIFPEASALKWIKAESLLQSGKLDEALSVYEGIRKSNASISDEIIKQRLGLIHQSKGGSYYQQGKFDLAEKHLRTSKTFMPDTLASYTNLALVYAQQEKWDKALKILDEGKNKFPKNANLQQIKANVLLENGEYDEVLREYENLYQQNPNNLDVALPYAQLLMAKGKMEQASDIYDRLIKETDDHRRVYESLVQFYDKRLNQDAKRQVLRKMQTEYQEDVSILNQIAQTYTMQEKWKRAAAVYDTVQTKEGHTKGTSMALANTYIQMDSLQAAAGIYIQALNRNSNDVDLLKSLGDLQQKTKNWKAAEKTYKTLIEVSNLSNPYVQLASVQEELGKADSAYMNYKTAVNMGSEDPKPYLQLSKIYVQRDSMEKAFQYGEKASVMAFEQVQDLQEGIVQKLEGNQNLAEMENTEQEGRVFKEMNNLAISAFDYVTTNFSSEKVMPLIQSLRKEYPQSGRLLYLISEYYQDQGRNQEAISLLRESVRFSPNLAQAHKKSGEYYQESDNKIKAIQSYERALSADSDDEETYRKLVELYQETGNLKQLCERWMAKYKANPENKLLKEYLIAALHKAELYEEAAKIINQDNP